MAAALWRSVASAYLQATMKHPREINGGMAAKWRNGEESGKHQP